MSEAVHDVPDIGDPAEIGRGGYGAVFRATDLQVGRTVAVKLLSLGPSASLLGQFERERASLGRLSTHPNVVTLHRTGVTQSGVPFLVMEFAPGGSLVDRLRAGGPFTWEDAVDWIVPVCDAVEHAHAEGVQHRDIKPQNILVSAHGQPLLSDFGIAALTTGSNATTQTARLSLSYASPEQINGGAVEDSTDVYSLGATLYTLIAGAPPFVDSDGEGILQTARRIVNDPPPPLDESVPVEIRQAISAAMAKDAARRPSVAEWRDALLGEVTLPAASAFVGGVPDSVTIEMPDTDDVPFGASALADTPHQETMALASSRTGGDGRLAALVASLPLQRVAVVVGGLVVAGLLAAAAWATLGDEDGNELASASSGAVDTDESAPDGPAASDDGDGDGQAADGSASTTLIEAPEDSDGDGVADDVDLCAAVADPEQLDLDGDGQGDACDLDDDGDGVADTEDNCPATVNVAQGDVDGDQLGDVCDDFPDADNDGVIDTDDPCVVQPDEPDADGDGVPDRCDETPRGVVAVAASVRIERVTILNEAYGDGEADMFGDLTVAGDKTGLPEISNQRDIRPANWSSGVVEIDSATELIRVRIWIRDEDDCFLCRDGLVDVTPEPNSNALHLVIDPATGTVDRASLAWNRIETVGALTGSADGDWSATITQEGDDDGVHRASMDVSLTLVRQAAP
ncbi:MAG: protein kinase [Actinomycetota bacterium]